MLKSNAVVKFPFLPKKACSEMGVGQFDSES